MCLCDIVYGNRVNVLNYGINDMFDVCYTVDYVWCVLHR